MVPTRLDHALVEGLLICQVPGTHPYPRVASGAHPFRPCMGGGSPGFESGAHPFRPCMGGSPREASAAHPFRPCIMGGSPRVARVASGAHPFSPYDTWGWVS
jgi:hypothetical protein